MEKELEIGFFILPVRSVGAQGDARTYKHPALLIGNLDRETLAQYSSRLTNTIPEINRCLRLVDKKGDIETMHVHPASYLTEQRLSLLRRADHLVTSILRSHNLLQAVWQFPVVLVPFGNTGETIILRPVSSTEAMTASFARLPIAVVKEIASQLLAFDRIDAVMYDITNKPPATIEWE